MMMIIPLLLMMLMLMLVMMLAGVIGDGDDDDGGGGGDGCTVKTLAKMFTLQSKWQFENRMNALKCFTNILFAYRKKKEKSFK